MSNILNFNIGDLVSWKGTKELGIVLEKHHSIFEERDNLLVSFIPSTSNTKTITWYDSKNFVKVAEDSIFK
jgi:hypothetical protein